jgi:hypothetical protein
MRSHVTRLLVTAVIATVAPAVLASPAQALEAPTFSTIDASTPGHASVTVTAPDSAYVAIWLTSYWSGASLGAPTFLAVSEGQANADLVTWGLSTGYVKARPCGDVTIATCGPAVTSTSFVATDVQPVITFPSDDTIGPGQSYVVDAVDPDGGGLLRATWAGTTTTLVKGGSTQIDLPYDTGADISVNRCSDLNPTVCRWTGISHSISVNKKFSYGVDTFQLGSINPSLGSKLRPAITSDEGSGYAYDFDWHVEDAASHEPVPGVSGTLTGLHADSGRVLRPVVDPSALTVDKADTLVGILSFTAPDYGDFVTAPLRFSFVIDTVAPSLQTISASRPTVYPFRDDYQDQVTFTAGKQPGAGNTLLIKVINSAHQTVQTFRSTQPDAKLAWAWNGKDQSRDRAPAGVYTIEATVTDLAGNTSPTATTSVKVIRERVVPKVFRHTYSAIGTLEHSSVGKCSTLARPSSRGWAGSLGYYSNAKCSKTFDDSVITTTHAARMPAAVKYGDLEYRVYGGATRLATRHIAYISYLNREGDWTRTKMLEPGTGWHIAGFMNGSAYVFDDRYAVWGVFNVKGSHYDVKSFEVKLTYTALVAE